MLDYFSIPGARYSFYYHDKSRLVTVEKAAIDRQGKAYIVARNLAIDGTTPDKEFSTYKLEKMSFVERFTS